MGCVEFCVIVAIAACEHIHCVILQKSYTALTCIGMYLLLEISQRCCTSGLVAHHIVKSTLRVSFLKRDCGNAQMAGCLDVAW